jgi:hypothetical protein
MTTRAAAALDETHDARHVAGAIAGGPAMRCGLITANRSWQTAAAGLREPVHRHLAAAVDAERIGQLETQPAAIVGESASGGYMPRNEERLLGWHQPATPLIQHIGVDIYTENLHASPPIAAVIDRSARGGVSQRAGEYRVRHLVERLPGVDRDHPECAQAGLISRQEPAQLLASIPDAAPVIVRARIYARQHRGLIDLQQEHVRETISQLKLVGRAAAHVQGRRRCGPDQLVQAGRIPCPAMP